jgi:hypothetical protein
VKKTLIVVGILALILSILMIPKEITKPDPQQNLKMYVEEYLKEKKSPLTEHVDFILQQKHWKLLIAISAIESQYCKIQTGYNCWGITKFEGGYRRYSSYEEGIKDANDLIERWQNRGRWLTVDDMNCHYVQPCNPNWVKVVNIVLKKLNEYEQRSTIIH